MPRPWGLTRLVHWLMIVLTVVVLAIAIWQWKMVGCIVLSRSEPASTDQIATLEAQGFVPGSRVINVTGKNNQELNLPQPTISYDKKPSVTAKNVPGLAAGIARCAQYVGAYNQLALVFLSYATVILVVYWLGRFIWWLRIRKIEVHE